MNTGNIVDTEMSFRRIYPTVRPVHNKGDAMKIKQIVACSALAVFLLANVVFAVPAPPPPPNVNIQIGGPAPPPPERVVVKEKTVVIKEKKDHGKHKGHHKKHKKHDD
jgi:hypothetical protein